MQRATLTAWLFGGLTLLLLVWAFKDAFTYLFYIWTRREEYSHGILLPFLAVFLMWQRKDVLERLPVSGAWSGVIVAGVGLALIAVGELATLFVVIQYGFVVVVAGLALAYFGWQGFRAIWFAVLILFVMVPLPHFILDNLSAKLQLLSSQLGVAMIRLFGVSVYLEGNVIDLGVMKLQVVEACNGLRYLFPLMTLALVCAHFYRAAPWKKAVLFFSSIPITLVLNSFRIAVIATMAEYFSVSLAEGFLHDFEGWAVFLLSLLVMLAVMGLLTRVGRDKGRLWDVFRVEWPAPPPTGAQILRRELPRPFLVAGGLIVAAALLQLVTPPRQDRVPVREEFSRFPLELGMWKGKDERLGQGYVEQLKLSDYLLTDFVGHADKRVNLYVAWYNSQRKGESSHSPASCLPGSGWDFTMLEQRAVPDVAVGGVPLVVNRVVMHKGEDRQLVYYWFQQRGRVITNEYLVKWYLFWDALTRNRTDGALVRVTMFLRTGESAEAADGVLTEFVGEVAPLLPGFVPG